MRVWSHICMASHPFLKRQHRILVMAHRGEKGHAPENTLIAFQRAAALNVDILETDVHLSADGHILAYHDETLERTTSGRGRIADKTLAEIKALDAGYTWTLDDGQSYPYRGQGITVPTLEELFLAFPTFRFNIDLKPESTAIVDAFAALVGRHGREDSVLVGSFHDAVLAAFRRAMPQVATAAGNSEARTTYILNKLRLGRLYRPPALAYQVPEFSDGRHVVTPSFVRTAHAQGREVHVWTVNDAADMRRLIRWGVDGIFTDYPAQLLEVLGDLDGAKAA